MHVLSASCYVYSRERLAQELSIKVAHTVIKICPHRSLRVQVANWCNRVVTLQAHCKIGWCERVNFESHGIYKVAMAPERKGAQDVDPSPRQATDL